MNCREITRVVEDLSASEKAELEEQDFYKRGEILNKISQRKRPTGTSTPTITEDLPQEGLLCKYGCVSIHIIILGSF